MTTGLCCSGTVLLLVILAVGAYVSGSTSVDVHAILHCLEIST